MELEHKTQIRQTFRSFIHLPPSRLQSNIYFFTLRCNDCHDCKRDEIFMMYVKAFLAGFLPPSLIWLTIRLSLTAWGCGSEAPIVVQLVPVVWGMWNVLYFAYYRDFLPGSEEQRLIITGGSLGLLAAILGVFVFDAPAFRGLTGNFVFLPLLIVPIIYAVLWRYAVKAVNTLFGL